jgi:hypothetical protein
MAKSIKIRNTRVGVARQKEVGRAREQDVRLHVPQCREGLRQEGEAVGRSLIADADAYRAGAAPVREASAGHG